MINPSLRAHNLTKKLVVFPIFLENPLISYQKKKKKKKKSLDLVAQLISENTIPPARPGLTKEDPSVLGLNKPK